MRIKRPAAPATLDAARRKLVAAHPDLYLPNGTQRRNFAPGEQGKLLDELAGYYFDAGGQITDDVLPPVKPCVPCGDKQSCATHSVSIRADAVRFAPQAETVVITINLAGDLSQIQSMELRVASKAKPSIGGSLALGRPTRNRHTLSWQGQLSSASDHDGFLALIHAPYRAWLHIEAGAACPAADSNDVTFEVVLDHVEIEIAPSPIQALANLRSQAGTGGRGDYVNLSPVFKIDSDEMYDDSVYLEYHSKCTSDKYGHVPLRSRAYLTGRDGKPHMVDKPFWGCQMLWDQRLPTLAEMTAENRAVGMHPAAVAFHEKASRHKSSSSEPVGATSPIRVGGIRGAMTDRRSWRVPWAADGWTIAKAAGRDWNQRSAILRNAARDANSGAELRVGRIPGDIHRVRVLLEKRDEFANATDAALDGAPANQRSKQIEIVNWRKVPVVRSWTVGTGVTGLDKARLVEMNKAHVKIDPAVDSDGTGLYAKHYATVVDAAIAETGASSFLEQALIRTATVPVSEDPQGATIWPVRFRTWEDYQAPVRGGGLGKRVQARLARFFAATTRAGFLQECDDASYPIYFKTAQLMPRPHGGLTLIKFADGGEHNNALRYGQTSYTSGIAPALENDRDRSTLLVFESGSAGRTLVHEVGHLMFLAHAPGVFAGGEIAGVAESAHDPAQHCIMSYVATATTFCGFCLAKLQGRKPSAMANTGAVK